MAGALWVTPVCPSVRMYICPDRHLVTSSNIFYQNFMKLGHIVLYHNVFKFDNGPYRTRLLVVMGICLWKFTVLNDVRSLTWIFFIRILWNLVTLFSTMMSSSCTIMVQMAPCFQELWPFVYEKSPFEMTFALLSQIVLSRILWNFVTLLSTMIFSSSLIMVYMAPCFKELLSFVNDNSLFIRIWQ